MANDITITISKPNCQQDIITTNGYLVIYLDGQDFKFAGTLNIKYLAPMLMKYAMEKMMK